MILYALVVGLFFALALAVMIVERSRRQRFERRSFRLASARDLATVRIAYVGFVASEPRNSGKENSSR